MAEEEKETPQETTGGHDHKQNKFMMYIGGAIVIVIIIAIALFLQNQNTQQPTATPSPKAEEVMEEKDSTVEASDQSASSSVTIDSATLIAPGYIVIHEQADGELGPVIGSSKLYEAGTLSNVSVTLDRASISGETLYAMLHDDDGNAEYEFPGADAPTTNKAGEVVVLPFEIL